MVVVSFFITGLSVVVSGTVNLDSAVQAAYNAVIPAFHDFMVSNAAVKVRLIY